MKYLHYLSQASNSKGHGMHSPFVFDFILRVLNNKNNYVPPAEIEQLRRSLLKDERILMIEDLGAGSRSHASKKRAVKQLARTALKPKKYAEVLYRMVKHYQPKNIIELGTSLGITTAYLAAANPQAHITTIEGGRAVAAIAKDNLEKLGYTHVQLKEGNFDQLLPSLLQEQKSVDLAYVDGNHRYQPTINYFHQLLEHCHNDSILVFDDIHWSPEMEQAWEEIKQHPSVVYTIDVFFLGFVFFRREFKVKQHFSIRF